MKETVIIVPGWGSPRVEWKVSPIPGLLRECGYGVEVMKVCEHGRGDITHNALSLAHRIAVLTEDFRHTVHIIGHSLGGLIAMECEAYAGGNPSSITTIGAPHEGTAIARFAPEWVSTSASQMSPSSNFIKANQDRATCPLFCIAGRFDTLIWPHTSAVHHAADKVMWVNTTHVGLIMSRKVAKEIKDYLVSFTKYW